MNVNTNRIAIGCVVASLVLAAAHGQNQALSVTAAPLGGYIEIPASPLLAPPAFTFEAWFTYNDSGLPTGYVYPTIGRKNFVQGIAEWFLRVDAGNNGTRNLRLWINGTSGVVSVTSPFAVGAFLNWTHVAATYDGAFARLYINGVQVAQATGTGPLVGLGAATRIGAGDVAVGGANERWNGLLDDVRIWSTARTAQEINAGMFQHILAAPNLNASYQLDGNGVDSSGNNNHGALVAGPTFATIPFPAPLYETNSPNSSLSFNGVTGTGLAKAVTTVCSTSVVTVNSDGPTSLPWDVAFNTSPTVPAGAPGSFVTGAGQVVNIDLTAGLYFVFGGLAPALLPYPGTFSASFSAPAAGTYLSVQQLNADPANSDGFSLSQAAQLGTAALAVPPTPIAGPTGDDSQVAVNVGCISFYGRSFSTLFIQSNGRITFGVGNTGFTPTAALFATNPPSFGCWTDFNPAAGGSITMTEPAPGVINVAYNGVAYFGTTTPNTFQLQLDTNTNWLAIAGLTGLAAGTGNMLIGVSGGDVVGATIPAPANFSPGGLPTVGATANATDMIYALGVRGSVTSGITRIDFFPNSYGNYDWFSQ